jgi:hypothetical protein
MILEKKLGVVSGLLSSLQTETQRAFWSSLSSLGTNLAEMCLMFKLSAKMRWMVPYDSPTIPETSWIVCLWSARIASWNFDMFSGVLLVDGRPERSSLSTDIHLSLKHLYHKKFCFGSWHYLQRFLQHSVRFCSSFFEIEIKFNADFLLLKTSHTSFKKIARSLKHNLTKTQWT